MSVDFLLQALQLFALPLCLIVAAAWWRRNRHGQLHDSIPPAAQHCSALWGHLLYLWKISEDPSELVRGLDQLARSKASPVVAMYPGPPLLVKPIFLVTDEKAGAILTTHGTQGDKVREIVLRIIGGPVVGTGLLGEALKQRRRVVVSALHCPDRLRHWVQNGSKHASSVLSRMEAPGSSQKGELVITKPADVFMRVVHGAVMDILTGQHLNGDPTELAGSPEQFFADLRIMLRYFGTSMMSPLSPTMLFLLHWRRMANMKSAVRRICSAWFQPVIRKRLGDIKAGRGTADDALSSFLTGNAPGTGLTADETCHEMLGAFFASDTANNTLQWLMLCFGELLFLAGVQ